MYVKKIRLIKNICEDRKFRISVAESCTGGLLSSLFTQISGASSFFDSGYVVYSNKSKINLLNVPSRIINKYGAVSKNTSTKMAELLFKKTKSDILVSITGVAGPGGGTKKNPVGTVYFTFGFKIKKKILYETICKKFKNDGRLNIQKKSALFAINQILKKIN